MIKPKEICCPKPHFTKKPPCGTAEYETLLVVSFQTCNKSPFGIILTIFICSTHESVFIYVFICAPNVNSLQAIV